MENGPKIIIVAEDEFLIRMETVEALSAAGFQVIEADHADDALVILEMQAENIHGLFTDVHMPSTLNGLELAHHVKRHWPWIALLIASGQAQPQAHELPEGSRFVAKPYDTAHVARHLHELTHHS
jgi:CheY-like chemotaxis protein